jgi:hypothetical protein
MNPVLPHLARAAGVGALLGIGMTLSSKKENPGGWILMTVVTSVALGALAYYVGVGAALGASLGLLAGLGGEKIEQVNDLTTEKCQKIAGAILVGGTLGYVLQCSGISFIWVW